MVVIGYKVSDGSRLFTGRYNSEFNRDDVATVNMSYCLTSDGDFIFMGGSSQNNYTLWDYDAAIDDDYYRTAISGNMTDATITRFHLPSIILSQDNSQTIEPEMLIYPNPTSGELYVRIPPAIQEKMSIEIVDAQGRLITTNNQIVRNGILEFDTNQLASGVYLLRVITSSKILSQSFMKI